MSEQREHERFTLAKQISVGRQYQVLELSEGGLKLASRDNLLVGSKQSIELQLGDATFGFLCEIRWKDEQPDPNYPYVAGVRFLELRELQRVAIRSFLAGL